MNAVDTNVLLYVHDPRDHAKQAIAASLLQSLVDVSLIWQVACEYLAASRKLEPLGFDCSQAWQNVQNLRQVWTTISSQLGSIRAGRAAVKWLTAFLFGTA